MSDWLTQWFRRASSFIRFVIKHFLQDGCRQNAAALTYTTLFAVVPIMTVTFTILSAIPSLQHVSAEIQSLIFKHFIPSTGVQVQSYISDFSSQASKLTAVGVAILFVTAIMMMMTIESAFNQIWKVREARKGVISFLRYWAVISLGPLLLGLGFAISSYVTSLDVISQTSDLVNQALPGLGLIPFFFTGLGFTLIYIAVPNCKVPLKAGLYGGFIAAFLFEIAKSGFGFFISNFSSYKLVYGAFAAFPIFLVWIFMSWMIVLIGVELTKAFAIYREESKGGRQSVLTMMDVLQLFYRKFQVGEAVSDVEAISVLGKQEVEAWAEYSDLLINNKIIQKTDSGDYVLARNLDEMSFWDFYKKLPWPLPQSTDLLKLHADDNWGAVLSPALLSANDTLEKSLDIPLSYILKDERSRNIPRHV